MRAVEFIVFVANLAFGQNQDGCSTDVGCGATDVAQVVMPAQEVPAVIPTTAETDPVSGCGTVDVPANVPCGACQAPAPCPTCAQPASSCCPQPTCPCCPQPCARQCPQPACPTCAQPAPTC